MNCALLKLGDKTSVASRLTSASTAIRPEKLVNVLAENYTGGVLYLHYFEGVTAAPANGTVPNDGFPVQAGLGGELGQERDTIGGIWCWSSTESTFTAAEASGSIIIILKQ